MIEPRTENKQQGPGHSGGGNTDLPTERTIKKEKKRYCDQIAVTIGEVGRWRESYQGYNKMLERKKCLFLWTEENYRRYRNTHISIGTELLQSNELIKSCITNTNKRSADLSTSLKNIFKTVKEVKAKLNDLREAACKLDSCLNDSCNCTQLYAITGEMPEHCNEEAKNNRSKNRPEECRNASENLDRLVCMPKALSFDIDSVFKASSDVIGIQIFSNIHTLEPVHKAFSDGARSFEKHLADIFKLREADLKRLQEELMKTIQNATISEAEAYKKRSEYEGLQEAINFICNPSCDCVNKGEDCERRLDDCEKEICGICKEVHQTFCSGTDTRSPGAAQAY